MWPEVQQVETGLSDLSEETSKLSLSKVQLEYASAIWDSHTKENAQKIEMV